MFFNNLISIPILVVSSFAFEDWGAANLEQNLYGLLDLFDNF
jgi:GDP-mannose transporter